MIFIYCLAILVLFLIVEKMLHNRRLKRIPIRIQVNGTRGKSTTVRLIAAALREAGLRTVAKTTGDTPLMIGPDGQSRVIRRLGRARIQEQAATVREAVRLKAEALVTECMALDPQLQFVSEAELIKSTLGVITNVRPDHQEVMGGRLEEIAQALSQTIPFGGSLITAEPKYRDQLVWQAEARGSQSRFVEKAGSSWASDDDGWLVFGANEALAALVCASLGLPPKPFGVGPALDQVARAKPGPYVIEINGLKILFIDAFSANDVVSTDLIQRALLKGAVFPRPVMALLNNRADRPLRMSAFAAYLASEPFYDQVILAGDQRLLARFLVRRHGRKEGVGVLKTSRPERMIIEIASLASSAEFTLMGMGNYKGLGGLLASFLTSRAKECSSPNP